MQDTLINASHLDIINNLLITEVKEIKVNSKKQTYITFRHEKFEGTEICCVKRWVQVISEGSSEHFFFDIDRDDGDDIANSPNSDIVGHINLEEFLKFVGLWLFVATISGYSRRQFWSVLQVHPFEDVPYRFHSYISFNRFEAIWRCHNFTKTTFFGSILGS